MFQHVEHWLQVLPRIREQQLQGLHHREVLRQRTRVRKYGNQRLYYNWQYIPFNPVSVEFKGTVDTIDNMYPFNPISVEFKGTVDTIDNIDPLTLF